MDPPNRATSVVWHDDGAVHGIAVPTARWVGIDAKLSIPHRSRRARSQRTGADSRYGGGSQDKTGEVNRHVQTRIRADPRDAQPGGLGGSEPPFLWASGVR